MVSRVSRFPEPGETLFGSELHTVPGGKGANQAVAAARLGARVSMVGRVGQRGFSSLLLNSLVENGVDHRNVIPGSQATTGTALIMVDDTGQNRIIVIPGINMELSPADVERAEDAISQTDVLLLQLEIPLAAVTRAVEIAHASGVKVVLNPAPAQQLSSTLLSKVDVLVPNETETHILTGMPVENESQVLEAAKALLDLGVDTAILTLGGRGAILARKGKTELIPAFDVEVVDTTAAGDAFMAGFSVALAEGKPLEEAVRWGNASGALATTQLGAQPSLPLRRDVERLLTQGTLKSA
jgi:ribokinase